MSRYTFALASAADEPQLRARMAQDWMEGAIAVSFRREPDYFAGCRLQGDQSDVIVCRDTANGHIAGLGSRCSSTMYLNGQAVRAGYLADLRGDPAYRNGLLLARGYRFLRALHEADPLPAYFTVIYDGNALALRNLVGGRAGLPSYVPMGRILTPALHLDFPKRGISLPGVTLRRARASELNALLSFLNDRMALRQFAPLYRAGDFQPEGRCAGLKAEDFFVAERTGRIVATVAAWDQGTLRQTHVERYSPVLALLRPLYNTLSRFSPLKALPAPGQRIPSLYLCCMAAADDDAALFGAVLRHAYNALRCGPWHYAIVGLHERDPLAAALQDYRAIVARGLLYRVDFGAPAALDGRIPYIEMAFA
jgi:hypothetical protein